MKNLQQEQKLVPRVQNSFLIFLIDHLNLPSYDKYGTQKSVSILRQIIEKKGFWHPIQREWIQLDSIFISCLCEPPTLFGRNKLTSRFLRHVSACQILHPSPKETNTLLTTVLGGPSDDISHLTNVLTSIYFEFNEHFRASIFPLYHLNLSDLCSLAFNIFKVQVNNPDLIFYEIKKAFAYRLQNVEEINFITDIIRNTISSEYSGHLFEKVDFVYTTFESKNYSICKSDSIKSTLLSMSKLFEAKTGQLFFTYDESLQSIFLIERALSTPGGKICMIGSNGSGRRYVSSFVAHFLQISIVTISFHKNFKETDFDSNLRDVFKQAFSNPCCLLLESSDLIVESFIQKINILFYSL